MRYPKPTAEEKRAIFDHQLAKAMSGQGQCIDLGFPGDVDDLLCDIIDAYPDIPQHLIDAVHAEFEHPAQTLRGPRARPVPPDPADEVRG
ncbi:hypothetical protein OG225_06910 [Nocardia sp. NBC_01377]|uniref:hypothetical protein n=1 Tax=Nocardia sp. NBC_01377 TaxID=2903595 RepID=UPI0032444EBE